MAIFHTDELRKMNPNERKEELSKLRLELIRERAIAEGGTPEKPGRIRELRKTIARIKTIQKELSLA